MRRIAQFIILIVLLIVSTNSQVAVSKPAQQNMNISIPNLEAPSVAQVLGPDELSRPILEGVNDTTGPAVKMNADKNRNDTLGDGAIFPTQGVDNVTIYYMVLNANSDTHVRLYADAPNAYNNGSYTLLTSGFDNESLKMTFLFTEVHNYTLPYLDDTEEIINATIGYFFVKLNVTSDYIRFYAAISGGVSEVDSTSPYNMLSKNTFWKTTSEDEFYIQDDPILINFVANTTDPLVDVYGFKYRLSGDVDYIYVNVTNTNNTVNFENQTNIGIFEIDNQIEWRSYAYLNDTQLNLTKLIDGLEIKFVAIDDGSPSLITTISSKPEESLLRGDTLYSRNNRINFTLQGTVPKGNITNFNVTIGLNNTIILAEGNVSTIGELYNFTHIFTTQGKFNVTIIAKTNKDLTVNNTYLIVIDLVAPTLSISLESRDQVITTFDGKVTFTFEYTDENSGVRFAILDFGDGYSVEVTNLTSYEHTYIGYKENPDYTITFMVTDWAGNTDDVITSLTLTSDEVDITKPPTTETVILFTLIIGSVLLYVFRGKIWK